MSFKALTVFAALLFTFALVNSPPAQACDTGGTAAGAPTFSFTAPQQVYAQQQFVAAPVVTQQFVQRHVVQQQFVAAPVQQFAVQQYAVAQPVAVQAVAVRQPRRQVQTQRIVTTNRASLLGR